MSSFSLLTVDCGYYLPSYKTINIYFMKMILSSKRKAIKNKDIRWLTVPQYEELTTGKILEFCAEYQGVGEYLPEPKDIPALPRQVSTLSNHLYKVYSRNNFYFLVLVDNQCRSYRDRRAFLEFCSIKS